MHQSKKLTPGQRIFVKHFAVEERGSEAWRQLSRLGLLDRHRELVAAWVTHVDDLGVSIHVVRSEEQGGPFDAFVSSTGPVGVEDYFEIRWGATVAEAFKTSLHAYLRFPVDVPSARRA